MERTPRRTYGSGRKYAMTTGAAQWDEDIDSPGAQPHSQARASAPSLQIALPSRRRVSTAPSASPDIYDFGAEDKKRRKLDAGLKKEETATVDAPKRTVQMLSTKEVNKNRVSKSNAVQASSDDEEIIERLAKGMASEVSSPKQKMLAVVQRKRPSRLEHDEHDVPNPSRSSKPSKPTSSPDQPTKATPKQQSPVKQAAASPTASRTSRTSPRRLRRSALEEAPQDSSDELASPQRPRTPPRLLRAQIAPDSPRLSPQQKAMYDAFGKAASKANREARPRRLMSALAQSKIDREPSSQSQSGNESPFASMIELAEQNLQQQAETPDQAQAQTQDSATTESVAIEQPVQTRATYSKQRTYLAESIELDQATYTRPADKEDTDDDAESSRNIRDVHDLRQGGEAKRFIDDLDYLLEGFAKEKTLLATLVELCSRLTSKDFARTFKAMHYDASSLDACKGVRHPLALVCCMLILIACQSHDPNSKSRLRTTDVELVRRALAFDRDIKDLLLDKSIKISKLDQSAAMDLRQKLVEMDAFAGSLAISPRNMALMVCNLFILPANFARTALWQLLESIDTKSPTSLPDAQLLLSALEQTALNAEDNIESEVIAPLVSLGESLLQHTEGNDAHAALGSALRLTINAVQEGKVSTKDCNPSFSASIIRVLKARLPSAEETSDDLILCLGVLIALTESSDTGKELIRSQCDTLEFPLITQLAKRLEEQRLDAVSGYMALLAYHLGYQQELGADVTSLRHGLRILVDSPDINALLSSTIRSYVQAL